jgi:glycosyltransferase involved in cell wall biosynthesis
MHVHVVDPSAFTPPYDHALCAALARAGAEVELISSRFDHGPRPPAPGFAVRESFYRHAPGRPGSAGRRWAKLAEHGPDLLRYRAAGRAADVVHVQWLAVPPLDARLLPAGRRGLVYTAHNAAREGLGHAERRLCARAGAVVVHSEAARLEVERHRAAPGERVHVVPHGAFDYLRELPDEATLPPELAAVDGPVALCFGLLRPYKGIDVLLEAWRGIEGAELWIVGAPRMDLAPLRAAAPPGVRFVPRFVTDPEVASYFRRAALVVLPHTRVDQSGAAFAALGFAKPLLLTDVGGFPDLAATGAAALVPPGDSAALHAELTRLLADPDALARMAAAAAAAAAGPYSWDAIARRTLEIYDQL